MPVIKLFSLVQLIGSITFILPVSITVKYQVHIYYWYLFSFTFGTPSPTRPAPSFFLEKCEKIHESINTLENITNPFYKSRGLPLHWRNWPPKVFRVASMACPPIFYIMAAEKEKMKTIFKAFFSRSDSKNIFKCVRPSDWATVQSRGRRPYSGPMHLMMMTSRPSFSMSKGWSGNLLNKVLVRRSQSAVSPIQPMPIPIQPIPIPMQPEGDEGQTTYLRFVCHPCLSIRLDAWFQRTNPYWGFIWTWLLPRIEVAPETEHQGGGSEQPKQV